MTPTVPSSLSRIRPGQFAGRMLVLAALWWVLLSGDGASWLVGGPVVIVAALVSCRLAPELRWRFSPTGAMRFAGFFLWRSLCGGVDVARRAFHPRLPLRPRFLTYPFRLPPGGARVFMANVISLQPGTLTAELGPNELTVHVLDADAPVVADLQTLEKRVAVLFRLELSAQPGGKA
jgi:multicomponent Na+:H+ antiporter subunit E